MVNIETGRDYHYPYHCIDFDITIQRLCSLYEPVASHSIRIGQRQSRHARLVLASKARLETHRTLARKIVPGKSRQLKVQRRGVGDGDLRAPSFAFTPLTCIMDVVPESLLIDFWCLDTAC